VEGKAHTRVGEVGFVAAGGVGDVFGGVLHFGGGLNLSLFLRGW